MSERQPIERETPNKDNPQADVEAIVEEILGLFMDAETDGAATIELRSHVGSVFHSRVKNAARHLGLTYE